MKKIGLIIGGVIAIAVIGAIAYTLWLTSDVEVATGTPVAATLVLPTTAPTTAAAPATATTASDNTAAATPTTAAEPTTDASQPAAAGAKIYRIDASQSSASYQVRETFLQDNKIVDAVGVTKAIAGDLLIDTATPANSQVGEIVVDISQLQSDSERRDNAIRREWLESSKYPNAVFKNAVISNLPSDLKEGVEFKFTITGDMTIHDTTNPLTFEVTATLNGDTLTGKATTKFNMSSFNVEAPDIGGMLKAEDEVLLTLDLVATAVAQ